MDKLVMPRGKKSDPTKDEKFMDVVRHFLTTSKDDSDAKDKAKDTPKGAKPARKRQSRKASK